MWVCLHKNASLLPSFACLDSMETYRRHKKLPDPGIYVREMRGTEREAAAEQEEGVAGEHKLWLRSLRNVERRTDDEHEKLVREIDELFRHYYTPVVFGARYRAPCPVWRSERIVLRQGELPRFATRVCIYQGDENEIGEDPVEHIDEIGGLLGFISLRPKDARASRHVAVAHLICPAHMKRPRYHILSTALGPPDGIMPFRGTPYYQPWVSCEQSGAGAAGAPPNRAICLHASLYSALLLKSSTFHCSPISSHDLLALLWQEANRTEGTISMKQIAESGFNLKQCESVLRSPDANAGVCVETVSTASYFHEAKVMLQERQRLGVRNGTEDVRDAGLVPFLEKEAFQQVQEINNEINLAVLAELKIDRGQLTGEEGMADWPPEAIAEVLVQNGEVVEFLKRGGCLDAVARSGGDAPSNADLLKHVRERRRHHCRARGRHACFTELYQVQMRLAKREARLCVAEYLANGMPVIASISEGRLESDQPVLEGHSVLVVGMHFQNPVPKPGREGGQVPEEDWGYEKSDNFLPSSFVLHDITQAPFWEVSASNLVTTGFYPDYDKKTKVASSGFSYLAVAPRGATGGVHAVRRLADGLRKAYLDSRFYPMFAEGYRRAFGLDAEVAPKTTCMRTRLMSMQDILRWYVRPVCNRDEPSDKELREDAAGYGAACDLIKEQVEKVAAGGKPLSRWWCVECHSEGYRSCAFRDYETWTPPILIFCWRIDQIAKVNGGGGAADPDEGVPQPDLDCPEFVIRTLDRERCEIRCLNEGWVGFPSRYVARSEREQSVSNASS